MTDTTELPPLPEPFMELHCEHAPVVYDAWALQMRAYAAEAVRVALTAERQARASTQHAQWGPKNCNVLGPTMNGPTMNGKT